jgi:hypothetical protein
VFSVKHRYRFLGDERINPIGLLLCPRDPFCVVRLFVRGPFGSLLCVYRDESAQPSRFPAFDLLIELFHLFLFRLNLLTQFDHLLCPLLAPFDLLLVATERNHSAHHSRGEIGNQIPHWR